MVGDYSISGEVLYVGNMSYNFFVQLEPLESVEQVEPVEPVSEPVDPVTEPVAEHVEPVVEPATEPPKNQYQSPFNAAYYTIYLIFVQSNPYFFQHFQ